MEHARSAFQKKSQKISPPHEASVMLMRAQLAQALRAWMEREELHRRGERGRRARKGGPRLPRPRRRTCFSSTQGRRRKSLEDSENLPEPDVLAQEIADDLRAAALEQFAAIAAELKR
jgi:hypothetical protein